MMGVVGFLKEEVCPECGGRRLSGAARAPLLRGIPLDAACTMPLSELTEWVRGVPESLPDVMRPMAQSICEAFTATARRLLDLESVARLLGADETLLPYCVSYGRVILIALIPFMLQNAFQSFLVTAERPHFGLYITIAAGVTNIVLDALFIAVLRLGVVGAALATTISQYIGGVIPLLYFIFPNKSKLRLCRARLDLRAIAKAGSNGASEFMTNISMSIVNMLYNWQLMRLMGSDGVAVFGVIMYVNFIFVSIFLGYSMGSAPIVGYHYGAGNRTELQGLLRKSLRLIGV